VFALRLLEQAGWRGVWVKNWGGREFWTDINRDCRTAQTVIAADQLGSEEDGSVGDWIHNSAQAGRRLLHINLAQ
jgi:hypothetical protein